MPSFRFLALGKVTAGVEVEVAAGVAADQVVEQAIPFVQPLAALNSCAMTSRASFHDLSFRFLFVFKPSPVVILMSLNWSFSTCSRFASPNQRPRHSISNSWY